MARILISGASGPIGSALLAQFRHKGHAVVRLVRRAPAGQDQIQWDPARSLSPGSVSGFDTVVHLAGESIVGRWNESKKARILKSRALGTRHLAEALAEAQRKPRVFFSASAIGYYGDRGDELLTESSGPGNDFLAGVTREWEAACEPARQGGIRTLNLRIGLMLSREGGALAKMLLPFRLGLGGRIGSGRQWWSWIHIADLVGAIHHAIENEQLNGPLNVVAPKPVTNAEFTSVLAQVLGRPAVFPVPKFAAHLAFGEMADQLLLASQRVEPAKLTASGYRFEFPELAQALQAAVRK